MPKQAVLTVELDPELRDAFLAEAEVIDRPAPQIVRDVVRQRREAREHDAWFRPEVEQVLREADDPTVRRTPHEEIRTSWRRAACASRWVARGRCSTGRTRARTRNAARPRPC